MPLYGITLLVFLAVAGLVLAIGSPRTELVRRRLEKYGTMDELTDFERDLERPLIEKVLLLIGERIMALVRRFAPAGVSDDVSDRLQRADYPAGLNASGFLMIKVGAFLVVPAAYCLYLLVLGGGNNISLFQVSLAAALFLVGYRAPDWWLNSRVAARQKAINRALPDALDLIVVCVEAGLAFEGAIGRVVDRIRGPLADEFRRTLGEISLGKRRRDALRDMATRTQASDLVSFIAAVVQADQTGISIGDVLRIQSDDLRLRRRQRAEREGREAPLKMLIPLIFFIFPATLIAAVGPAALKILDHMMNGS